MSNAMCQTKPERQNEMRRIALVTLMAALPLSLFASRASAQAERATWRRWSDSVDMLLRRVSPSVVQIMVTGYRTVSEGDRGNAGVVIGRQKAIGSGFVIDASGYIVTNAHVVNGAQRVQVALPAEEAGGYETTAFTSRVTVAPARILGVSRNRSGAAEGGGDKAESIARGELPRSASGRNCFCPWQPAGSPEHGHSWNYLRCRPADGPGFTDGVHPDRRPYQSGKFRRPAGECQWRG